MQDVLRYQYLKIVIIKVFKMLLKGFFLLVWTDLRGPINEIKQMPAHIQMVTNPYRVTNDKSHSCQRGKMHFLIIQMPRFHIPSNR